jgi:hypothetical protein
VILSVNDPSILTYQWRENGIIVPGQMSSTYQASAAGVYTCSVTNNCGSGISDTIYLNAGTTPVITQLQDSILCTGDSITLDVGWTYQYNYVWHDNSTSNLITLTSQTQDSIIAWVRVTNNQGCVITDSATVNFEVCNGIVTPATGQFTLFPNPAHDKLMVYAPDDDYSIKIIDVTGRIVSSSYLHGTETKISVSNFDAGVYFLQLSSKTKNKLIKFIKE